MYNGTGGHYHCAEEITAVVKVNTVILDINPMELEVNIVALMQNPL